MAARTSTASPDDAQPDDRRRRPPRRSARAGRRAGRAERRRSRRASARSRCRSASRSRTRRGARVNLLPQELRQVEAEAARDARDGRPPPSPPSRSPPSGSRSSTPTATRRRSRSALDGRPGRDRGPAGAPASDDRPGAPGRRGGTRPGGRAACSAAVLAWERVFGDLSRVLPANVWLEQPRPPDGGARAGAAASPSRPGRPGRAPPTAVTHPGLHVHPGGRGAPARPAAGDADARRASRSSRPTRPRSRARRSSVLDRRRPEWRLPVSELLKTQRASSAPAPSRSSSSSPPAGSSGCRRRRRRRRISETQTNAAATELAQKSAALEHPAADVNIRASDGYLLKRALPDAVDMPSAILDIERLAQRNDLDFSSLRPSPSVAGVGYSATRSASSSRAASPRSPGSSASSAAPCRSTNRRLDATGPDLLDLERRRSAHPSAPAAFPVVKASVTHQRLRVRRPRRRRRRRRRRRPRRAPPTSRQERLPDMAAKNPAADEGRQAEEDAHRPRGAARSRSARSRCRS